MTCIGRLSLSNLPETEKVCRSRLIISCAAKRYQLTYLQWKLQVGLSMMQAHQTLLEAGGWSKLFLKVITAHVGGPIQGAAALFQTCLKNLYRSTIRSAAFSAALSATSGMLADACLTLADACMSSCTAACKSAFCSARSSVIIGNSQSALISSHAYDSMQPCKQTYEIDARFV